MTSLPGVTVRTLHHYDRIGLLKPCRTEAGYRLYSDCDLARLEQIVAMKFLGLPLKQIKALLERNPLDAPGALSAQRRVLEEKRRRLDSAIGAIREAELALQSGGQENSAVWKKIIEAIEMQNNSDWMLKYYSDEAQAKVEERRSVWTPELQERVSKQWSELFREVEAALDQDPAGAEGQALADMPIALTGRSIFSGRWRRSATRRSGPSSTWLWLSASEDPDLAGARLGNQFQSLWQPAVSSRADRADTNGRIGRRTDRRTARSASQCRGNRRVGGTARGNGRTPPRLAALSTASNVG